MLRPGHNGRHGGTVALWINAFEIHVYLATVLLQNQATGAARAETSRQEGPTLGIAQNPSIFITSDVLANTASPQPQQANA